jgi:N6-L-threonylcarbamoyladenine synthase
MDADRFILGIETSCDDTSLALVTEDGRVRAIETTSQFEIHAGYGGIYPELASRAHVAAILPALETVLQRSGASLEQIEAIAVTRGPGLIGALLVGVNTATALGLAWDKPVIGVNHLRGHLRSAELEGHKVAYPAVVLLVSGGHSLLAHMTSANDMRLLGQTRDDSVGEAFDKVARMLDLGFPGGPIIDQLAARGEDTMAFPRPMLHAGYEFSFSGLKSAVRRAIELDPQLSKPDACASFAAACFDVLIKKCERALKETGASSLVVVGGVAASRPLRARMQALTDRLGVSLNLPPAQWAPDNGAMIALAGWDRWRAAQAGAPGAKKGSPLLQAPVVADPGLALEET